MQLRGGKYISNPRCLKTLIILQTGGKITNYPQKELRPKIRNFLISVKMQLRGDGEVYLQPSLPQDSHDASEGQVPQHTVRGIVQCTQSGRSGSGFIFRIRSHLDSVPVLLKG